MRVRVEPCRGLSGTVAAPPSKNYTTRYLLAAGLAEGESLIVNPARNDDAMAMMRCLEILGAEVEPAAEGVLIRGFGGRPRPRATLDVGNAGAVLRFLLAVAALGEEISFHTPFPDSLGKRPHGDLLEALSDLGARVESNGGRLPIVVRGGGIRGGRVEVRGSVSSQFTSALLFLAPLLPEGLSIQVKEGLRSRAAVRTTLEVMAHAGIEVEADWEHLFFRVPGDQRYRPGRFTVNGDYPGAAAILAAAVLVPGEAVITGLFPDAQGERSALEAFAAMGAEIAIEADRVRATGGRRLRGIVFEGDRAIDAVLSLATVAAFAEGESVFTRVGHLRFKESDRLCDFAAEMRRVGLDLEPRGEELIVRGRLGRIPGGAVVSARQDHRLVMALAAAGLRSEQGLVIEGAEHVAKSYPGFFADLRCLGAAIVEEG